MQIQKTQLNYTSAAVTLQTDMLPRLCWHCGLALQTDGLTCGVMQPWTWNTDCNLQQVQADFAWYRLYIDEWLKYSANKGRDVLKGKLGWKQQPKSVSRGMLFLFTGFANGSLTNTNSFKVTSIQGVTKNSGCLIKVKVHNKTLLRGTLEAKTNHHWGICYELNLSYDSVTVISS